MNVLADIILHRHPRRSVGLVCPSGAGGRCGTENRAALAYCRSSLPVLVDHLLRRMSPLGHLSPFYSPILTYWLDQSLRRGTDRSRRRKVVTDYR